MIRNDYENILERLDARQAVLFLGSGSTVQCERPSDKQSGLTGHGLAREILQQLLKSGQTFPIPDNRLPSLMEAAEYYQNNHPGRRNALDRLLQSRLKGLQPTLGHYLAASFPWKAVITTNYNTVAEDAWTEAGSYGFAADEAIPIRTDEDILMHAGETTKIRIYKPHGCVNVQMSPNHRMVITSQDYALSEKIRSGIYAAIRSLASTSTTVFIGYSLADYTFRNMYYRLLLDLGEWSHQCYSVAPIDDELLFTWKSNAMAELNTTLINTSFDAFMLNLLLTRGTVHPKLRNRITESWNSVHTKNLKYLSGVTLDDLQKLPEPSLRCVPGECRQAGIRIVAAGTCVTGEPIQNKVSV
jgi:SIR2-like domain